jgi:hypothetical protein
MPLCLCISRIAAMLLSRALRSGGTAWTSRSLSSVLWNWRERRWPCMLRLASERSCRRRASATSAGCAAESINRLRSRMGMRLMRQEVSARSCTNCFSLGLWVGTRRRSRGVKFEGDRIFGRVRGRLADESVSSAVCWSHEFSPLSLIYQRGDAVACGRIGRLLIGNGR